MEKIEHINIIKKEFNSKIVNSAKEFFHRSDPEYIKITDEINICKYMIASTDPGNHSEKLLKINKDYNKLVRSHSSDLKKSAKAIEEKYSDKEKRYVEEAKKQFKIIENKPLWFSNIKHSAVVDTIKNCSTKDALFYLKDNINTKEEFDDWNFPKNKFKTDQKHIDNLFSTPNLFESGVNFSKQKTANTNDYSLFIDISDEYYDDDDDDNGPFDWIFNNVLIAKKLNIEIISKDQNMIDLYATDAIVVVDNGKFKPLKTKKLSDFELEQVNACLQEAFDIYMKYYKLLNKDEQDCCFTNVDSSHGPFADFKILS